MALLAVLTFVSSCVLEQQSSARLQYSTQNNLWSSSGDNVVELLRTDLPTLSVDDLITLVKQGNVGDCVLIAVSKAALSTFGGRGTFKKTETMNDGGVVVTLQDDAPVTIHDRDLTRARNSMLLRPIENDPHAALLKAWMEFLGAVVIVHAYELNKGKPGYADLEDAAATITKGQLWTSVPRFLGLEKNVECMNPFSKNHWAAARFLKAHQAALAQSAKHVRFAYGDVVDEHGVISGVRLRVWRALAIVGTPATNADISCLTQ